MSNYKFASLARQCYSQSLKTDHLTRVQKHSSFSFLHAEMLVMAMNYSSAMEHTSRDSEDLACQTILDILAQEPHTQVELLRKLKFKLPDFRSAQLKGLITRMVEEKSIHELPAFLGTRILRYSLNPPDPKEYIDDAIAKISKSLGVPPEAILQALGAGAPPEPDPPKNVRSEELLARMVQIKLAAAAGGLVPINELWKSLQIEGWDKASFDRTVLGLSEQYRVALQRHNFPASLSGEDRAELVADELGNYYVGISLR